MGINDPQNRSSGVDDDRAEANTLEYLEEKPAGFPISLWGVAVVILAELQDPAIPESAGQRRAIAGVLRRPLGSVRDGLVIGPGRVNINKVGQKRRGRSLEHGTRTLFSDMSVCATDVFVEICWLCTLRVQNFYVSRLGHASTNSGGDRDRGWSQPTLPQKPSLLAITAITCCTVCKCLILEFCLGREIPQHATPGLHHALCRCVERDDGWCRAKLGL